MKTRQPGVYVVSLSLDVSANAGLLHDGPVAIELVTEWISRVPTFTLYGKANPDPEKVRRFLQWHWLPDESVLYIGKATCLRDRLSQLFRHRLGDAKPHAGGHWLKTLSILPQTWVYAAECDSVATAELREQELLGAFVRQVSPMTRAVLYCPEVPIPFANREYPPGTRKQRIIGGDVLR